MPSNTDVVLWLRNIVCATRTCSVSSRGKHLECRCSAAYVCQGLSQNVGLVGYTVNGLITVAATASFCFYSR